MTKPPSCPRCHKPLTWEQIKSLYGAGTQALRTTRGGNPRPVGRKPKPQDVQQPESIGQEIKPVMNDS